MSGTVCCKVTCWGIGLVVPSGGPWPPGCHVHVVTLKDPTPLILHLQKREASLGGGPGNRERHTGRGCKT